MNQEGKSYSHFIKGLTDIKILFISNSGKDRTLLKSNNENI